MAGAGFLVGRGEGANPIKCPLIVSMYLFCSERKYDGDDDETNYSHSLLVRASGKANERNKPNRF